MSFPYWKIQKKLTLFRECHSRLFKKTGKSVGLQVSPSNRRHFSGRIWICEYSRTSMCGHLLVSNHLPQATANPQHQNFPSQNLTVGTSSYKRPPPVSVRDHFLGLTVKDFRLFLISFSDHLTHSLISMFAVCTMLLRIYEELKWQHGTTHVMFMFYF